MLRAFAKEFFEAGFDIEILEKHHNQKLMHHQELLNFYMKLWQKKSTVLKSVYDRSSLHEKRKHESIGIQAMRGGTIFGEHTVMFAGNDEIIEIKHTALSKEVFVQGAISAAYALLDKDHGLYTLKSLY
ncbi:dihydrodipicolinate reductase C-terminal domain-containing protein [Coprobacillaceae bacterium CR2/5/TPMF4]|nr:dihydrodipicolinate reductase C-terminal domain-containing protein [Coprobacillaceae bacterium CR2/5/TPMF4]